MTRAFVAVVPPPEALDAVERSVAVAVGAAPSAGRFTPRPQWHITLQFLGDQVDVDAVGRALGGFFGRAGALRLGGAGAFGSARRGRVLWLGVHEGHEWLASLAAEVGESLRPTGFEPEDRPYHGHLTLARWNATVDLRPAVAALGSGSVGPEFAVGEVVLFESRLGRSGAEHEPRARIPLLG